MGYHHLLIFVIAPILSVSGHGNLVWPYVWQDAGGSVGLSSYGHMTIGGQILFEDDMEKNGLVSMWYTNYTFIVGKLLDIFNKKCLSQVVCTEKEIQSCKFSAMISKNKRGCRE